MGIDWVTELWCPALLPRVYDTRGQSLRKQEKRVNFALNDFLICPVLSRPRTLLLIKGSWVRIPSGSPKHQINSVA
jgi:hypothetical protein